MSNFPKFLPTVPVGEDHFSGGTQERISSVIADQILHERFSLIGVDGKWGAGKSNVIRQVEKKLNKSHHFFIYDAWSHHEDLQRRTFLEELTTDLAKAGLVDRVEWQEKIKKLHSKSLTAEINEKPKVSLVVILVLIVIVLIPIANAVADSLPEYRFREKIWVKVAPYLVVIIGYLYSVMITGKLNLNDLGAIYREKAMELTRSEIISEDETSISKFRDWMESLSKALNPKKLVIVFDNMDRLPDMKVKQMWSHIHTFFSEKHYDKITVIVPFDRDHVGETFGAKPKTDEKVGEEGTGEYYISKTFPIVFSIPPTSFADWRKFFIEKFKEAFGESDKQAEDCATIYDVYNHSITPREFISFINNIVALSLIWGKTYKLKYLALYCATRRNYFKKNARAEILAGNYAEPAGTLFRGDEKLPGIMAALYYNLSPDKAAETILFREIELAIRERKYEQLGSLKSQPDFYAVLEDVLNKGSVSVHAFVIAIHEMEQQLGTETSKNNEFDSIWYRIIGKRMGQMESFEKEITASDEILLQRAKNVGRLPQLASCICAGIADTNNFNGDVYAHQVIKMEGLINKFTLPISLENILKSKELSAEDFLSYAAVTKDDFNKYKVTVNPVYLESRLVQLFPEHINTIYPGLYLSHYQMPSLLGQIEKFIVDKLKLTNIDQVYEIYRHMKSGKLLIPGVGSLEEMLLKGKNDSLYNDLAAMRISAGASISLNSTIDNEIFDSVDLVRARYISEKVLQYVPVDQLFNTMLVMKRNGINLVVKCIVEQRQYEDAVIDLISILPYFSAIKSLAEVEESDLLEYLNHWHELIDTQVSAANFTDVLSDPNIFSLLRNKDTPIVHEICKIGLSYVRSIEGNADWVTLFANPSGYGIQLLALLIEKGYFTETPANALVEGFEFAIILLSKTESNPLFQFAESFYSVYANIANEKLTQNIAALRTDRIAKRQISPYPFLFLEPIFRRIDLPNEEVMGFVNELLVHVIGNESVRQRILDNIEYYEGLFARIQYRVSLFFNELRRIEILNPEMSTPGGLISLIGKKMFTGLKIEGAKYVSSQDAEKFLVVTERLQQMLKEGKIFHFKLENTVFGESDNDPHFGVTKELIIDYSWKNERKQGRWKEAEWVSFPE